MSLGVPDINFDDDFIYKFKTDLNLMFVRLMKFNFKFILKVYKVENLTIISQVLLFSNFFFVIL